MNIDFSQGKITLVIAPIDLRLGFNGLALIAHEHLNIDVLKGGHHVVFISRSREIAKIISHDACGSILITRRLSKGRYQQLLSSATGKAIRALTPELLSHYLNGQCIDIKRTHIYKN